MHSSARSLGWLVAVSMALVACGDEEDGSSSAGSGASGASGSSGSGGAGAAPFEPSGYLLIPKDRLEEIRGDAEKGAPAFAALKANVDSEQAELNQNNCGPENVALVYLLTGEQSYADSALAWARMNMEQVDVAGGSYLDYGHAMRRAALVLNWAGEGLDSAARDELADYLDRWSNELWFDNMGSGWGLEDPGNNYHMAFLEGTAFAGYALREHGHENAQKYIDVLLDKLDSPEGVIAYLNERGPGGDWHEGANYGERSKQRLFSALSVIASMGGKNYWGSASFFPDTIYYAVYATLPGGGTLYPSGDLARDVKMPVSPYERDYLQTGAFWLDNAEARGLAQWYLADLAKTYDEPGFRALIFKDVLFGMPDAPTPPESIPLPLSYRATGTEWLHVRTGWDAGAVALGISGSPLIDQSHAHYDVGSFTFWKNGWLAPDAVTYSHDGLNWDAGAHNMVTVNGHELHFGDVPGLVHFFDDEALAYAKVDASNLFWAGDATMLTEYTRDLVFLKPQTLVVYDRVDPKSGGEDYEWRLHFPIEPTSAGGLFRADAEGAGISLLPLRGGAASVAQDSDLVGGASEAYRVVLAPEGTTSRFLAVIGVQDGSAPDLAATHVEASGDMEGAAWEDQVVLFSVLPFGASPALPFTYVVPGDMPRTHTLAGLTEGCDVMVSKANGSTTVTVAPGSMYTASAEGLVRFQTD